MLPTVVIVVDDSLAVFHYRLLFALKQPLQLTYISDNLAATTVFLFCFVFLIFFCLIMSAYCVYVLKVASIDGLMPFSGSLHCTTVTVNLCFVM